MSNFVDREIKHSLQGRIVAILQMEGHGRMTAGISHVNLLRSLVTKANRATAGMPEANGDILHMNETNSGGNDYIHIWVSTHGVGQINKYISTHQTKLWPFHAP